MVLSECDFNSDVEEASREESEGAPSDGEESWFGDSANMSLLLPIGHPMLDER